MSIYNALIQRNSFALSLHHRSSRTANAAELLARLMAGGNVEGLQQDLSTMAKELMHLLESQHSYPVLLFFRFRHRYYDTTRTLLLLLDTVTLIKSALDVKHYRSLVNSAAVEELWGGSLQMLGEVSRIILSKRGRDGSFDRSQWRERYFDAVNRLKAEEIVATPDLAAGAELYIALRENWNASLLALANYMDYDWDDIAPYEY